MGLLRGGGVLGVFFKWLRVRFGEPSHFFLINVFALFIVSHLSLRPHLLSQ